MGAGVSQQTLSRAARKRLQKLQADFNMAYRGFYGRAVYIAATKQRYPEVVFPDGTVASVNVIRASNGEAFMQLIAHPPGDNEWVRKPGNLDDLAFVKKFLT